MDIASLPPLEGVQQVHLQSAAYVLRWDATSQAPNHAPLCTISHFVFDDQAEEFALPNYNPAPVNDRAASPPLLESARKAEDTIH